MNRWLLLAVGVWTTGCAGWDGVIDPRVAPVDEPGSGPAVVIEEVVDARAFQPRSYAVWTPSVYGTSSGGEADRGRIIGRRQQGKGGNLRLPEGRSVEGLVADALASGLRRAGARVVDAPGAAPIRAEIVELWTWDRVAGLNAVPSFEFWTRVRVRGDVAPFRAGGIVCGYALVARAGPGETVWTRAVELGLADLADVVRSRVTSPDAPYLCKGP
jgi:hypothetical protein